MIRFHEGELGRGLKFKPPMHFIPSTATSTCSNERDHRPGEKRTLPTTPLSQLYINKLTFYDILLAKKGTFWHYSKGIRDSVARNPFPTSKRPRTMAK